MSADPDILTFPKDFIWGAATASYQIEGAAGADGKSESIWDTFCRQPGTIVDGSSGDDACRHYDLWQEDVALMASLGLNGYRFSVSWPRVAPDGLTVNPAGLDFYDRLVDGLLDAGIEPFLTLYHWDLPQAIQDRGGWLERSTAEAFGAYSAAVADRLGDRVKNWITLNEPYVISSFGYVTGEHAPGLKVGRAAGFDAAHHLLLAHARSLEAVRASVADAAVGITLNFTPVTVVGDTAEDQQQAALNDSIENRWFLEPLCGLDYPQNAAREAQWQASVVAEGDMAAIAGTIDFLGVNYYTRQLIDRNGVLPAPQPTTTMGWEIHPQSLAKVLEQIHSTAGLSRYFITENGAAMPDHLVEEGIIRDDDRIEYVQVHLAAVAHAISTGVPVGGYFLWTLLDNFEWGLGYTQRFGIVAVDPETYERVPKASAHWYRDLIAKA